MSAIAVNTIRICGALFIFLCHACSESDNAWGTVLGQVFNVGVPIFFMLSGYLHSQKNAPSQIVCWYGRKLKRLLMPLWLFLGGLALIYAIAGHSIVLGVWIHSILPICGLTQKYISGCGHLWFITHLLLCYLITPSMQRHSASSHAMMFGLPTLWFVSALAIAYTLPQIWCTLLNSVFTYAVGLYILPSLLKRRIHIALTILAAFVSGGFRIIARALWDGTPFYNSIATTLSHVVFACAIILFISEFVRKATPDLPPPPATRIIAGLSARTYAFYLVHYVFLTGVIQVRGLNCYTLNVLIAFVFASVFAEIVYQLDRLLIKV